MRGGARTPLDEAYGSLKRDELRSEDEVDVVEA
jgi:hypothetical protein